MTSEVTCPVCGSKTLTAATHELAMTYGGRKLVVTDLEHYECAVCGSDPAFPGQIKRNELKIADAKRRSLRLLTSGEIRDFREELGLSQAEAAELFGGGANAFSKYERGEVIQSVPMDRLLRTVHAHPYLAKFLRAECSDGYPWATSGAAHTFYFTQAPSGSATSVATQLVTMIPS